MSGSTLITTLCQKPTFCQNQLICFCNLQAEIPTTLGVADDPDVAMETDDIKREPAKKYFIDTNSIRLPRKNTEMQSFLKDGMGKG